GQREFAELEFADGQDRAVVEIAGQQGTVVADTDLACAGGVQYDVAQYRRLPAVQSRVEEPRVNAERAGVVVECDFEVVTRFGHAGTGPWRGDGRVGVSLPGSALASAGMHLNLAVAVLVSGADGVPDGDAVADDQRGVEHELGHHRATDLVTGVDHH